MRPFHLPFREWRRLRRRAYAAQQDGAMEVAGVFGTNPDRRLSLIFLRNESDRSGHFELSCEQTRAAEKRIRAQGIRYLGIFHSHPASEPTMVGNDLRWACLTDLHLIYDVCATHARLWRVVHNGRRKKAIELPLIIQRTKR